MGSHLSCSRFVLRTGDAGNRETGSTEGPGKVFRGQSSTFTASDLVIIISPAWAIRRGFFFLPSAGWKSCLKGWGLNEGGRMTWREETWLKGKIHSQTPPWYHLLPLPCHTLVMFSVCYFISSILLLQTHVTVTQYIKRNTHKSDICTVFTEAHEDVGGTKGSRCHYPICGNQDTYQAWPFKHRLHGF